MEKGCQTQIVSSITTFSLEMKQSLEHLFGSAILMAYISTSV